MHRGVLIKEEQPDIDVEARPFLTRVCPSCRVQSQTAGPFCPNCGKGYLRVSPWRKRKVRLAAIVVAAVVLLAGGGAAITMSVVHNNSVVAAEATAKEARDAERVAANRLASQEQAREAADDAERAVRVSMVGEIEGSITTDAQAQVDDETLEGPILRSSCTPLGGGSTDDLTSLTTTFTCIAINADNVDGTSSGYRFSATMNWDEGSYTWHLGS